MYWALNGPLPLSSCAPFLAQSALAYTLVVLKAA
jgi:hypothetical protein